MAALAQHGSTGTTWQRQNWQTETGKAERVEWYSTGAYRTGMLGYPLYVLGTTFPLLQSEPV